MIFLRSSRNREHIATHRVHPEEAEQVIGNARRPFPCPVGDDKHAVMGRTSAGRHLHVVLVYAVAEDVEADEHEELALHEKLALDEGDEAVRVIHARDLTEIEKRQLRRRRRGMT